MNFFKSLVEFTGLLADRFCHFLFLILLGLLLIIPETQFAYGLSTDCFSARDCEDKEQSPVQLRDDDSQLVLKVSDRMNASLLRGVSLDQMIGQMLMLSFHGQKPTDTGTVDAQKILSSGKIGGLIFMGHNMKSRAQISALIGFIKKGSPLNSPPFLAIDQEGGQVQRLQEKHGFTTIPTAHELALHKSTSAAFKTYKVMANELADVGFNVNFGPVVDLNLVPQNPIIGKRERSYGQLPATVESFSRAFVMAHRQNNILTALKHFPGHGSSWTDSHEQFVDLSQSWKQRELEPYRQMISEKLADMVMVGHLYHPNFSDGNKLPASLSKRAIEGVLRGQLGYKGLVVTDDLGMGAIRKYFSFDEALIRSIRAGNDIIMIVDGKYANSHEINRIHGIIIDAVKQGHIPLSTIQQSYLRIIKAKKHLAKVRMNKRR